MRSMRSQPLSPDSTRLGGGGRGGGPIRDCQSPRTASPPPPALKRRSSSGLETWFRSPQAESSDEEEGADDESSISDASEVVLVRNPGLPIEKGAAQREAGVCGAWGAVQLGICFSLAQETSDM